MQKRNSKGQFASSSDLEECSCPSCRNDEVYEYSSLCEADREEAQERRLHTLEEMNLSNLKLLKMVVEKVTIRIEELKNDLDSLRSMLKESKCCCNTHTSSSKGNKGRKGFRVSTLG